MKSLFAAVCISSSTFAQLNKHWGLIVGGGTGFEASYPYQSDAAQAYRVCQYQHLQDDEIVYMAYDDIATNP